MPDGKEFSFKMCKSVTMELPNTETTYETFQESGKQDSSYIYLKDQTISMQVQAQSPSEQPLEYSRTRYLKEIKKKIVLGIGFKYFNAAEPL